MLARSAGAQLCSTHIGLPRAQADTWDGGAGTQREAVVVCAHPANSAAPGLMNALPLTRRQCERRAGQRAHGLGEPAAAECVYTVGRVGPFLLLCSTRTRRT